MKKLALALCSTLVLLGACATSVTAPQPQDVRVLHEETSDTVSVAGGHGMGSGN